MKKQKNGVLEFNVLSLKNEERCEKSYHAINDWSPTDWACAVAGETGEMCNFVKKLRRLDSEIFYTDRFVRGTDTNSFNSLVKKNQEKELIKNIGKELADVVIYADLLATRLGLRLGYEVKSKFNETSKKIKSKIKL